MRAELPHRSNRAPQLVGVAEARVDELDSGHVITSAPGYVVFVQQLHNGRWQTITVDPNDVGAFAKALEQAIDRSAARHD